ncbi:12670_t:CDS:2 [Entrophospora sp. SA101]|nr:12670_t:CDS:2 [Entrophospora sp. SA101]
MKDKLHVDEEYAIYFNKTYSNNAMRYHVLKTSSIDNISYPSYDFMMLNVTSIQKEGYGIIDTMVVDHGNGGLLINNAIKPNLKTNGSYVVINNTDINSPYIKLNMTANGTFFESPVLKVNFEEPKTVNSGKSLNSYFDSDVKFNSTLSLYALIDCASVVEASVKTIKLQSSITGSTNVIDVQTIPAQWYIEKGTLNIAEMNPWWGGVEFGEKLPNNSFLVSENTLLLPAGTSNIWDIDANAASAPVIAVDMMRKLEDSLKGYRGDGIGNLALLQQWKEEGLTEKDISGMYKRQWNDIMINMVTPTNQAKIVGTTQFTVNKTCYDVQFATQYLIAMFGLIIIFYILLASLRNVDAFNSLIKIRHVVQQMDLGKVIINVLEYGEANTVGPSQ